MKCKYYGDKEKLVKEFKKRGWYTEEEKGDVNLYVKTLRGMILNYWKNGTLLVQGKQNEEDIKELNKILSFLLRSEN